MATLTKKELKLMDEYFRVLNYLSVGQLYLLDNPLLTRPLTLKDIKPNVVGHWGTAPGQNFIYTHLNRIIKKYNLNINYNNKQYWNNVFNEQINEFFKYLLNLVKEKYPLFKGEIEKLSLVEESHEFANLPLIDNDNISKKEVIIQMLKMFKANSENANLEKLNKTCKFSNRVGRKNGNNINSFILYNKSVTGLKEDELDYEF